MQLNSINNKLNIVILGESSFESNGFHMAESLNYLGHKASIVTYYDGLPWYLKSQLTSKANYYIINGLQTIERRQAENLAVKINRLEPNLVITLYRHIHPSLILTLRKSLPSTKFIHINSDHIVNLARQQLFMSDYDLYFVKDPFMFDIFKNQLGYNTEMLAEYCNPRIVPKPLESKEDVEKRVNLETSIFGNIYPYRSKFIEYILLNNLKIKVFGAPGRYMPQIVKDHFKNEFIGGKRKAEILYGSKVVFNNFFFGEVEGVNQKFFEIFGVGGCQICTHKEIIKNYSPIDPELFTFKNRNEAVEKAYYYINNPEKRFEISDVMYKHFIENHTIDHRMNEVLNKTFPQLNAVHL